ncbi:GNAT family N-acetyltransferase [Chitinibacter sp. FCG-7]|uniref:GNAT family N-acetyltransferase n=1 Tax=Chitinibacter mangrovi TaxID=3153927 RepID=A0AAU7FAF4_9NEIS
MNLISFRPELQNKVEEFLQFVQAHRGCTLDRANLPADIKHIQASYQHDGGDFWLLLENASIIGCIAVRIIDQNACVGEIKRYFVLPSHQRQGLGGALIAHAIGFAKLSGLKKIRLDSMKQSTAALAIFRKHGFYEIPKYNDNPVAEVFMEKCMADSV